MFWTDKKTKKFVNLSLYCKSKSSLRKVHGFMMCKQPLSKVNRFVSKAFVPKRTYVVFERTFKTSWSKNEERIARLKDFQLKPYICLMHYWDYIGYPFYLYLRMHFCSITSAFLQYVIIDRIKKLVYDLLFIFH